MQPNLPVSVRFGARPPGVVIDATFALSPMGLLVTMVLSRIANVWLPQALRDLLDNDTVYRADSSLLGGDFLPEHQRDAIRSALALELRPWNEAWLNGRLSSRVHWIGDAQPESALPDREEITLRSRCDECGRTLNAILGILPDDPSPPPLELCARDAIALAAALQPDNTYIICGADRETGEPLLGGFLGLLRFQVQRQPAAFAGSAASIFAPAMPAILASNKRATVVQVIAPAVVAMRDYTDPMDWCFEELPAPEPGSLDDPWRNACALWQPLGGGMGAAA